MKLKLLLYLACFAFGFCTPGATALAEGEQKIDTEDPEALLLELEVARLLSFDLDGFLREGELYLPAVELLSILKLPHTYQNESPLLEVLIPATNERLRIDFIRNRVQGSRQAIAISSSDYLIDSNIIFLHEEWLEQVFGFTLNFDFRKLKVTLSSETELPVIRDYRRKQRYEYFAKETQSVRPEVTQPARHYLLNGWIIDWTLSTAHNKFYQDYAYGIGLGGHLLGGDFTLHTKGARNYDFRWNQIHGRWSFPFCNSTLLQQVTLGDQAQPDIMGGNYLSYQGVSVTNRPKAPRRIFGTYNITRLLADGWDAELYVNNVLSDIAIGDSQDTLRFNTPLRYGSNTLALKFYDPDGMSHQQNLLIHIPYELLPPGKLEYHLSAGNYRNLDEQLFAQADFKWGVSSHMTLGGGLHYTSKASGVEDVIPYVQTWLRLGTNLTFEGSHANKFLTSGQIRYSLPGAQLLRLSVKKYHRPSVYNKLGKLLDASFNTSLPLRLPFLNLSTFLSTDYTEYISSRYLSLFGGASTTLPLHMLLRINSQLSYRTIGNEPLQQLQHTFNAYLSKRLLRRYLVKPGIQYDHNLNRITLSQFEISRRVFKNGFLSFTFQHNHRLQQNSYFLRFSLNLPFARHSSFVNAAQAHPTLHQSTSGTIALDQHSRMYTDDRSWMGKAAARIDPFLDLNNNDKKDRGEPRITGLKATFYESGESGYPIYRNQLIAKHLAPYEPYLVRVNDSSVDNPLWIPKYRNFRIQPNPNMVTRISVPVVASGEVTGSISMSMQDHSRQYNLSNLTVYLSDADKHFRDTLRTFSNGSFFYVGLKPGHYTASLDRRQLASMALSAVQDSVQFVIEPEKDGDIVEGVNLQVALSHMDQSNQSLLNKVYTIQIGAFNKRNNALRFAETTRILTGLLPEIVFDVEDGMYKCRLGLFNSSGTAWDYLDTILQTHSDLYRYSFVIEINIDQMPSRQ
jgi:hypothetical protein